MVASWLNDESIGLCTTVALLCTCDELPAAAAMAIAKSKSPFHKENVMPDMHTVCQMQLSFSANS